MEWLYFALLSTILFGIVNIFDKFILSKINSLKLSPQYAVIIMFSHFFFAALMITFNPLEYVFPHAILGISIGFLWFASIVFYSLGLYKGDVSNVIPFLFLTTLFIAPLAFIFLGESLITFQYIGIILMVIGAITISYKKIPGRLPIAPFVKYIFPSIIIGAILSVTEKFILTAINYWSLYFYASFGGLSTALITLTLFPKFRNGFIQVLNILKSKFIVVVITQTTAFLALITFFIAISMQFVSIVSSISALQPFFVFIYTVLISRFFPKLLKERYTKASILLKIISITTIFIGSLLVTKAFT